MLTVAILPFVSNRWNVEFRWFRIIFTRFATFQWIVSENDLSSSSAPRTFVSSFPFPEKFLFCTDRIVSTEWRDLVPRQWTGDCSEIHFLRWGLCDLLLKTHHCMRYDFTSTSSARGPSNFSPLVDLANTVFREVRLKTVIAQYHSSLRL